MLYAAGWSLIRDSSHLVISLTEDNPFCFYDRLGFLNFYRCFIDNYSGIVNPLTSLLKKGVVYEWSETCESSFQVLKQAFTEAPVLRHYDPEDLIVLECDTSDYAIAGIISQYDGNGEL